MNKPPTIWMNVTTSANWKRPAVGIVRVEREIANALSVALPTGRFRRCIWHEDQFIEYFGEAMPSDEIGTSQIADRLVEQLLPSATSFDLARNFLRNTLIRRILRSGKRRGEQKTIEIANLESSESLGPAAGDILISIGLDWDQSYSKRYFDLRTRNDIIVITCCYDLIPVLFPQYCVGEVATKFAEYFIQLAWGSSAVLCISKNTQKDFNNLCLKTGAPRPPTAVIALGDAIPSEAGEISEEVKQLCEDNYIVYVSTIERRKNHEVLYKAIHILGARGCLAKIPKLVFVGMQGWGINDLLKDIELDPITINHIIILNHVSDAELRALYKNAYFCVYPSLYEGWGLPVAEALAMGKTVVASDMGSLPEVGGDLVRYVSPWNAEAWANEIEYLSSEKNIIETLEGAVREKYKIRTWDATAAQIIKLVTTLTAPTPSPIILLPGYDMSTLCGVHAGPAIIGTGLGGILLFGPHRSLREGSYVVTVHGHAPDREEQFRADCASNDGKKIHAENVVNIQKGDRDSTLTTLTFTLRQPTNNFEVRLFVGDGSKLRISRVAITLAPLH